MGKLGTLSRQAQTLTITLKVYPLVWSLMGLAIAGLVTVQLLDGWRGDRDSEASWVDPSRLPAEIPPAPSPAEPTDPQLLTQVSPADPAAVFASNLRVSNRTTHPIRIALLARTPEPEPDSSAIALDPAYAPPAHWDFAPEEGSQSGLLLSLPDQDLTLQLGDIVVAFAQDGSRLYWGPYVVGETEVPRWDDATQQWQLILNP